MSRQGAGVRTGMYGFPRVSGDEPQQVALPPGVTLFSPRERG